MLITIPGIIIYVFVTMIAGLGLGKDKTLVVRLMTFMIVATVIDINMYVFIPAFAHQIMITLATAPGLYAALASTLVALWLLDRHGYISISI